MKKQIPVKKNENYIIDIIGQGHEGQGVGKIEGFTVFVEGALKGEKVEIKVVKVVSSHAFGKLLQVLDPSSGRTTPFCGVYQRCGGCHIQHMSYEAQLEFKTEIVREAIKRIGGLKGIYIKDALGMKQPLSYRNKAQYPVGIQGDQEVMGFYANRSHEIISGQECAIQHSKGFEIASVVKDFINEKDISTYDEKTGKGIVRHIITRTGFNSGESMVVIVANADKLPYKDELVEYVRLRVPEITSLVHNVNKKNTNVILGEKNIVLYGREYIADSIGKYSFKISTHSFFQVNPIQTEVLYNKALEYAELSGNETVFDLYCGIGTISLFLSEKAKKVYGVEAVEPAVKDAIENARMNGIANVEFVCGEAEKVVPEMYGKGIRADVVVLDPPRKGCDRVLLDTVAQMKPERVVYVSCNPATLARDLNILDELGYRANEIQSVDMFPHTYHVEAIVLMTYCGKDKK